MGLKLKALEKSKIFYLWKLREEGLREKEQSKYLLTLKSIERVIQEKERSRGKRRHKKFRSYDRKRTVFQNTRRGY